MDVFVELLLAHSKWVFSRIGISMLQYLLERSSRGLKGFEDAECAVPAAALPTAQNCAAEGDPSEFQFRDLVKGHDVVGGRPRPFLTTRDRLQRARSRFKCPQRSLYPPLPLLLRRSRSMRHSLALDRHD